MGRYLPSKYFDANPKTQSELPRWFRQFKGPKGPEGNRSLRSRKGPSALLRRSRTILRRFPQDLSKTFCIRPSGSRCCRRSSGELRSRCPPTPPAPPRGSMEPIFKASGPNTPYLSWFGDRKPKTLGTLDRLGPNPRALEAWPPSV